MSRSSARCGRVATAGISPGGGWRAAAAVGIERGVDRATRDHERQRNTPHIVVFRCHSARRPSVGTGDRGRSLVASMDASRRPPAAVSWSRKRKHVSLSRPAGQRAARRPHAVRVDRSSEAPSWPRNDPAGGAAPGADPDADRPNHQPPGHLDRGRRPWDRSAAGCAGPATPDRHRGEPACGDHGCGRQRDHDRAARPAAARLRAACAGDDETGWPEAAASFVTATAAAVARPSLPAGGLARLATTLVAFGLMP